MVQRLRSIVIALLGLQILAGCTAIQLTYNNANSLARYMAWDYVDPDEQQAQALQQRFAAFHDWHRANELPRYADFMQQVAGRVSKGVSGDDIAWAMQSLRATYRTTAAKAAQEAAPILVTLRPDQIESIRQRLQKDEAKYTREWLAGNPARRERRLSERTAERIEQWTGDLTRAQRDRIEQFVKAHPRIMQVRLDDRRRWQKQALDLIGQYKNAEELGPRLARLMSEPDSDRSEEYVGETRAWERDLAQMLVDIDASLSPEQRSRVVRRMERYAEDFRQLSRSSPRAVREADMPGVAARR